MTTLDLTQNKPIAKAVTFLLLAGSTVLVLFDIRAVLDIFYAIFALGSAGNNFTTARVQSTLLGTLLMLVLGLAAMSFIIYMFEHHMRRAGEPRSLRAIAITLGVQVALPLVALLV